MLCPNTALCHQVVRLVAAALTGADGQPLLTAAHISSSSPPPFDPPDIVVTTPGALKTLFNDRGAMYGSLWTAEAVSARSAFVVVDEADLLWQGSYVKDLTRLLDVSVGVRSRKASSETCVPQRQHESAANGAVVRVRGWCWSCQGKCRVASAAVFDMC